MPFNHYHDTLNQHDVTPCITLFMVPIISLNPHVSVSTGDMLLGVRVMLKNRVRAPCDSRQ